MGNFVAWLLAVPTAALVLAYVVICACILNAKRRMTGLDSGSRQSPSIDAFHSHTRRSIPHAGVMARRGG